MRFFIVTLCITLLSLPASGQWYQTQGHAYINDGNIQAAKNIAMENALKKALLVAGASVSSVQQVVNGLLTQDEINIRATGSVNSFELIDETYQDQRVSVTIRADIFPQSKQCFSADYRKSLLLTKSQIKHREQANIGGIYTIDKVVMKKLAKKLNNEGLYLDTKLALQNRSEFSRYNHSIHSEEIKKIAMSLADYSDSQYILFSEIQDISFANDENNSWQFWQEDIYNRHFDIALYIYNGSNGELVFNKEYRSSAPWEYSKRTQVDINSNEFWQQGYGMAIDQTLTQMISDIDESMMCQPTRGKIVKITGNQIVINLGSRHGVKSGDEFSLLHVKNFTADSGIMYAGFNVSEFKVKVTQVSQQSATAITADNQLLDSIQLDDLAVRY
jgi:hypothetical protein